MDSPFSLISTLTNMLGKMRGCRKMTTYTVYSIHMVVCSACWCVIMCMVVQRTSSSNKRVQSICMSSSYGFWHVKVVHHRISSTPNVLGAQDKRQFLKWKNLRLFILVMRSSNNDANFIFQILSFLAALSPARLPAASTCLFSQDGLPLKFG